MKGLCMEDCSVVIDNNIYNTPKVEYSTWSKDKLINISNFIDRKLSTTDVSTVIVFEIGHFTLPYEEINHQWAYQNMVFANDLCGKIIKKHKFKYKIIPTLLVNNLDSHDEDESERIIENMLKNQKYINKKSLKIISERNLKNRAFKALKKDNTLSSKFIHIDGKAYLKDDDYQHDLAAGFVNENGDIIPRCGLILTSYLDEISRLAKQRLHQDREINILFISFSQQFYEYKRVMLGVDIYSKGDKSLNIDPMIFHWNYLKDQALLSYKENYTRTWENILF
jgi:hypothetical protein